MLGLRQHLIFDRAVPWMHEQIDLTSIVEPSETNQDTEFIDP